MQTRNVHGANVTGTLQLLNVLRRTMASQNHEETPQLERAVPATSATSQARALKIPHVTMVKTTIKGFRIGGSNCKYDCFSMDIHSDCT